MKKYLLILLALVVLGIIAWVLYSISTPTYTELPVPALPDSR